MKRIIILSILFLTLGFSQAIDKGGDVRLSPRLLNYQGFVTDTLGNPINDTLDFLFRIYPASSGGTAIWTEIQLDMIINEGIFHAALGSVTPLPDSVFTKSTNRWLEMRIAGQTMSPRTQITAAGYAFTATYSDTAEYARSAPASDSCRISANSHKLQGKDTTALDARYVNEGQAAGGVLAGTYPNPSLVDNAVTTTKILDSAVTMAKINRAGANPGQVIKWNGTAWQPDIDANFPDNDWLRGTVPLDTVLFTASYLGLARGGAGNIIYGTSGYTITNWGVACTTGRSAESHLYSTIGGGYGNCAEGNYSVISGGQSNKSWANLGTIGGGYLNRVEYSGTVAGGYGNYASGMYATVGGGDYNRASGEHSVIAGGMGDTITGNYGTIGGGYGNHADYNAVVGGGAGNIASGSGSVIGGGAGNTSSGSRSTVAGGESNTANAPQASVGGGYNNMASGTVATIAGGSVGTASGSWSAIGGGRENAVLYDFACVAGGWADTAKGYAGGVFSGYSNLAGDATDDTSAVVAGGYNNSALAKYTFVGGGLQNLADYRFCAVLGGDSNTATSQECATVCGGRRNTANGPNAFLGGGRLNYVAGSNSVICGGYVDSILNAYSFIGGGEYNKTYSYPGWSFWDATIGGGTHNVTIGDCASILGGENNYAGNYSSNSSYQTVGGGYCDTAKAVASGVFAGYSNLAGDAATDTAATVCGGYDNSATGKYSFVGGGNNNVADGDCAAVPGGRNNSAAGLYAFAAGRRAKANNQGCFVWGDATDADIAASTDNRWLARCSGGVYFYTNAAMNTGVYVAAGSGTWNSVSDRNLKENFEPVDGAEVLNKLATMPIQIWNYKSQDKTIRHIGPMAQDFASFGVGDDDKHIATIDADGIAFAAIQELNKNLEKLETENRELRQRIETLENK